jgi:hypothetical protein
MTTLGIGGTASEMAALFNVDGTDRNNGIESRMDLDAILEYTMKKYREKQDVAKDGWEEEDEES